MKGDLLWVYEGLTEYLGEMLTPRSGSRHAQEFLDSLARKPQRSIRRPGARGVRWKIPRWPRSFFMMRATIISDLRRWHRFLRRRHADLAGRGRHPPDAEQRTRSPSTISASLRGPPSTATALKPYTFDDVVRTLNSVQPYDWAGFLRTRLESTDAPPQRPSKRRLKLIIYEQPKSCQQNEARSTRLRT